MSSDLENEKLLLERFLKEKPVCAEALACLKKGVEIQLTTESGNYYATFYADGAVQLEERKASKADVEFFIKPSALQALSSNSGDTMGQLGIDVVKEVVAGEIQIKVIGKVFSIFRNGYLEIIRKAGPEFMGFLGQYGFKSITKIMGAIRSMKK